MKLTATQASEVFDILLNKGNRENKYADYNKADFIDIMERGTNEYWYSSNCGSSIKVYFSHNNIYVYPQTINHIKEATLVEDTNAALAAFVAREVAAGLAA